MFCSVLSAAISGVDAVPIEVEADVSDGMPSFTIVGYVSSQVREAQDRVRTALRNLGISLPPKRITINLSPGDLRKEGTRFDLPIAVAILEALGMADREKLKNIMVIGELHLDGSIAPVTGILPSVIVASERKCKACMVPVDNLTEGKQVQEISVIGLHHLSDIQSFCRGTLQDPEPDTSVAGAIYDKKDFSDIRGQETVKRAALIAAAGFHNLLLSGPPGSGKSMTAERIPSILPAMTRMETLEISKIYSIMGLLSEHAPLLKDRPFRSPHYSITATALCGGGIVPRPGEVTLSHRGVLFLDELPEMNPAAIEMLRQPLETREITISRLGGTMTFPASFLLIAAMNPCPCGYHMSSNHRCTCTEREIQNYQNRVSQAFLDRMDLRCDVPPAEYEDLTAEEGSEISSAIMRGKVERAVAVQTDRYQKLKIRFNSELSSSQLSEFCRLSGEAEKMMKLAFEKLGLSARGYHRTLKVARTIADLDGEEVIRENHVNEALCFRCRRESKVFE